MLEKKNQKNKKKSFPRWLRLSLYKNCFGEGELVHLGIKFRGVFYCITHSKGNGVEIPKKYLQMRDISSKPEYFKKCETIPEVLHKTQMKISESFIVQAILQSELNK